MSLDIGRFASSDELEAGARATLTQAIFDRISGGADDESTLAANLSAWRRYRLRPRVLVDTSTIDLTRDVLGTVLKAPIFISPMGVQTLAHPSGELGTAAAAGRLGIGFACSTAATVSMEELAEPAGQARWFQLYVQRDRGITCDLIARAQQAGYRALLLTVDVPVTALRRRDLRNSYRTPAHVQRGNFTQYENWAGRSNSVLPGASDEFYAASLTWSDLDWLKSATTMPLVVKGITTAADARLAVDRGADGVYVSNHGGRQLGRLAGTAESLVEVVDAVAGRATVLVDGGVREPADVVVALALGADAVGIGRPALWALACGGPPAVHQFLSDFIDGVRRTMVLLGRRCIDEIELSTVAPPTEGMAT